MPRTYFLSYSRTTGDPLRGFNAGRQVGPHEFDQGVGKREWFCTECGASIAVGETHFIGRTSRIIRLHLDCGTEVES